MNAAAAADVDLRLDAVLDVGPVEARDEVLRLRQLQPLGDLAVRRARGGGRERHARHAREALGEVAEGEVVRAEVVPPLATRSAPRRSRSR
jgi:hypothetical protein